MFAQESHSRAWPKIFAARGDGPVKGISPIHLTHSRHDIPCRESVHEETRSPYKEFSLQIEDMFKETVREKGTSSLKTGKKRASKNDEEALAGIMKEISNEVESFHTLYNSQCLLNKSKASDVTKLMQNSSKPGALKVGCNNDTRFTDSILNKSSMQDAALQCSKLKLREQDQELASELSKLNLGQKSPSPSHTECITSEKHAQKKVDIVSSAVGSSVNALTEVDRHDFKMAVGVSFKKATQAENMVNMPYNNTQAQVSRGAQRNEFKETQSTVNDSGNALTDAERQTFKDALIAMNAETEREERRAAAKANSKSTAARRSGLSHTTKAHRKSAGAAEKTPIWSSSSTGTIDVKKYNRQSVPGRVVQSQSFVNKPQYVRRSSDVHIDKQKKTVPVPLVKREMQEKHKAAIYHNLPCMQPMSLSSIPYIKNGNFQAGFVRPVPLESGVLHVSPSAPLVSKHYTTKNKPPTTDQSKFQRKRTQIK